MGYTESLLAEGEVVAMRGRQHWLALLLDSRTALGVWILAAVLLVANLFFFSRPEARTAQDLLNWIVLALVVIGLLVFAYRWLWWINQDYVVTNRRMLKVEGIINKKSMDSSLEKINDLVLEENLIGRILDYGDLDILTASDSAIDRYRMLAHAKDFKKEMLDQKHALEQGDFYRPSPPMMATAPADVPSEFAPPPAPTETAPSAPREAASPTPEPTYATEPAPTAPSSAPTSQSSATTATTATTAAPSSPSPSRASELAADDAAARGTATAVDAGAVDADDAEDDEMRDVTRTLARLADLRDRGAITPEDYEAKKSELLGRL